MAEVTSALVKSIVALIVIFVCVALVWMLFPQVGDKVLDFADETFQIGRETFTPGDVAENTSLTTANTFNTELDTCFDKDKNNCFCDFEKNTLPEGHMILFANQEDGLGLRAMTENQKVILDEKYANKNIGLFIVKIDGDKRELGCIFPTTLSVQEKDDKWAFSYNGKEYALYEQKVSKDDHYEELAWVPEVYSVNENDYCILTDLVEEEPKTVDSTYKKVTDASTKGIWPFKSTDFTKIYEFFNTAKGNFC
tara:strand:+ start:4463 stop:5218 length:756 start_codon:yes stop_codon:yes gene_type:complete